MFSKENQLLVYQKFGNKVNYIFMINLAVKINSAKKKFNSQFAL